mmetsp:Transcript_4542/g.14549  ORF Transcript_4542/g.14549 Transcript_4542/m.14549 type:complete len:290 (+) Transcript_4542:218-1087(+)
MQRPREHPTRAQQVSPARHGRAPPNHNAGRAGEQSVCMRPRVSGPGLEASKGSPSQLSPPTTPPREHTAARAAALAAPSGARTGPNPLVRGGGGGGGGGAADISVGGVGRTRARVADGGEGLPGWRWRQPRSSSRQDANGKLGCGGRRRRCRTSRRDGRPRPLPLSPVCVQHSPMRNAHLRGDCAAASDSGGDGAQSDLRPDTSCGGGAAAKPSPAQFLPNPFATKLGLVQALQALATIRSKARGARAALVSFPSAPSHSKASAGGQSSTSVVTATALAFARERPRNRE